MISVNYKEWCLFYKYIDRYIVYKLYYRKMFNLIILVVIDIISQILFYCLIESFCLSVYLKVKGYRKLAIPSEFYNECYKESKGKSCTSIYYEFIWQSMVVDDFSDNDIYEIFC